MQKGNKVFQIMMSNNITRSHQCQHNNHPIQILQRLGQNEIWLTGPMLFGKYAEVKATTLLTPQKLLN